MSEQANTDADWHPRMRHVRDRCRLSDEQSDGGDVRARNRVIVTRACFVVR